MTCTMMHTARRMMHATICTPHAASHRTNAMGYSDEKVANRDIKVWHCATELALERRTNPIPLGKIVDRAAI